MPKNKFFIVEHPLSATHTKSLLGRIVCSKTSPLDSFAPFPSSGTPAHDTDDIIPTILPPPQTSAFVTSTLETSHQGDIGTVLTSLVKADVHIKKDDRVTLECDELRRYELVNPSIVFRTLMANEHYANDVRQILETAWPRHAYLVTGFLVAVNSKWTTELSTEHGGGANVSLPVAELAGNPFPSSAVGLDVSSGFNLASGTRRSQQLTTTGEEIIAVSYSVAKLTYEGSWTAPFWTARPKIGRSVRAKSNYKSMGGSDSDSDFDSDDQGIDEDELSEWSSNGEDVPAADAVEQSRSNHVSTRAPTGVMLDSELTQVTQDSLEGVYVVW